MKVQFNETKFVVNEEKKTVTCVINAQVTTTSGQDEVVYCEFSGNSLTKPYLSIGVAKCSDDDKFNEELGKRIAESRAKAKVYEEGMSRIKQILKYIDIFGTDAQDQIEKLKGYWAKEKDHLDELKFNPIVHPRSRKNVIE